MYDHKSYRILKIQTAEPNKAKTMTTLKLRVLR